LVVTLTPGDLIEIREERRRSGYIVPIAAVFDLAVKIEVAARKRAKADARSARKGGRA
jgi:hypothetical protein